MNAAVVRIDLPTGVGTGPLRAVARDLSERVGVDLDQSDLIDATLAEVMEDAVGRSRAGSSITLSLAETSLTIDVHTESPAEISPDALRMADATFARFDPAPRGRPGGFVAVIEQPQ